MPLEYMQTILTDTPTQLQYYIPIYTTLPVCVRWFVYIIEQVHSTLLFTIYCACIDHINQIWR